MASVTALRAILGASLGLGAIDVLWLDMVLAPKVVDAEPHAPAARLAAVPPAPTPDPAPVPAVAAAEPPTVAPAPPVEPAPAEPAPAVEPPPAPPPEPPPAPDTAQVYFETRSAELDSDARANLDLLAGQPGTFVLEGHADARGRERFNDALSRDRALAVQAYLVERGVDAARIEVRYVGEDAAVRRGELWRDRRVDIEITGGPR